MCIASCSSYLRAESPARRAFRVVFTGRSAMENFLKTVVKPRHVSRRTGRIFARQDLQCQGRRVSECASCGGRRKFLNSRRCHRNIDKKKSPETHSRGAGPDVFGHGTVGPMLGCRTPQAPSSPQNEAAAKRLQRLRSRPTAIPATRPSSMTCRPRGSGHETELLAPAARGHVFRTPPFRLSQRRQQSEAVLAAAVEIFQAALKQALIVPTSSPDCPTR